MGARVLIVEDDRDIADLVAQRARFVDLDGPLLLAEDRAERLRYDGSLVYPSEPALWG